jgi:hypothetical protein
LLHSRTDPKKLTHFIKGPTKASCRWKASKPTHGVVPLFDASVVLLQPIVEIMVASMGNVLAEDLSDGTRVRTVSICGHSLWSIANSLESLAKKALGCIHISLLTEHGINQVAILINGSIQIAPLSLDPHIGFIHMPGASYLTTSFCAQVIGDEGSEPLLPISNRLMSEGKTTFQEYLGKVT